MNLKLINERIEQFKTIVQSPEYGGWRLWELMQQFQSNWDVEASDFKEMFGRSLAINSPMWHRDDFYPKKVIERYLDMNQDIIRSMFVDLLNESREIDGRISRFIYQMNEIQKVEKKSAQFGMPHYHDSYEMIFVYLSFAYPDRYTLYDFNGFKSFMAKVGATKPPQENDVLRYVKFTQTMTTLMKRDEELLMLLHKRFEEIGLEEKADAYLGLGVVELFYV